ncbi:MAG: ribonuclease R [Planctomycetes bacterium]|nr:ribonuclease R [Planctomycetota bacterium]
MPQRFTNRIMRLIRRSDYQPLKQRALSRTLNVPDDQYDIFRQAVEILSQQKKLVIGPKNTITLPDMSKRITGTYSSTRQGYGFIRPDDATAQGDLFIPNGKSLDAVSGDRVVAHARKRGKRDGETSYSGEIIQILERGVTQLVGTLAREGKHWFVTPDGKEITEYVSVDDPGAKDAQIGDKVLVEIVHYPTQQNYAHGIILERLGKSGNSAAELKSVIRRFNLQDKFSRQALNQARKALQSFNPKKDIDAGIREDIRSQTIITIDPTDARDFDDAISLRKLPHNHWLLGVHIADVSTFVTPDTPLDEQAHQRGTSVYLPQHVIPMLPEHISNNLCSLQQDQDRFTKSAYIKLDQNGKVLQTRFANSLIRSTHRFTYEDVDQILEGKTGGFNPTMIKFIRKMEQLAKILHKRRQKDGMLTLDLPKADLIYDNKGRVIDAKPESTTFSHTMIEMFMVEANEAVARLLDSFNVAFLRRIHPEPDNLATSQSSRTLKLCGYTIPKNINRKGLQDLLKSVRGKPESFVINLAILKSMQPAEYSPAPIGHYALASTHYCHFTSPIRRYPDLHVHRLLQAYLEGRLSRKTANQFPDFEQLASLGQHCTQTEKNAEDAENDLRQQKLLQMLSNRVGEESDAIVTSITNFGLFVQLDHFLVEGLIRSEDVTRTTKKPKKGKSNQRRSPRTRPRGKFTDWCPYKLGQKIKVKIAAVNPPARTLDLVPINQ